MNSFTSLIHGTILLLGGLGLPESSACDRPRIGIDWGAAMADHVFVGRVKDVVGEDVLSVNVVRSLKGTLPAHVQVKGVPTDKSPQRHPCQTLVGSAGAEYTFFVSEPTSKGRPHPAIDSWDGMLSEKVAPHLAALENAMKNAGSSSNWNRGSSGISVRLVSKKRRYEFGEDIDLDVLMRNDSDRSQSIRYRTWPPTEHAFCEVISLRGREKIPPQDGVPTEKEIRDFFSKHGPSYDVALEPHQIHRFFLDRVNSAKPGWGYKERTGFKHVPMPPGDYQVSVRCRRFTQSDLTTHPIAISVVEPPRAKAPQAK